MGKPAKILSKEDLERAMKMSRSNFAAARYLHVSYNCLLYTSPSPRD